MTIRLLRAATNAATQSTNEEDAFESLVNATRRDFRRTDGHLTPRGRRKKDHFFRKVLLTKLAHIDFLPGRVEQRFLKDRGLGKLFKLFIIFIKMYYP